MLAQLVSADRARALDDEADRRAGARGGARARSGFDLQHRDLDLPLGEAAEALHADTRLLGIALPVEMLRLDQDRLIVARLGIFERALVDVLPHRLIAVAIALHAGRQIAAAREDALLERPERLQHLHALFHAREADIAAARGAAELQGHAVALAVVILRPVGRAFREIGDLARLDPLLGPVIHRTAAQHDADLIEIVLVARAVEGPGLA